MQISAGHVRQDNVVRISLVNHPLNGKLVRIIGPANSTSAVVMVAPIDNEADKTPVKPRHLRAA